MIYLLLIISFIIHFLLFRVIIQLKNKVDAYEQHAPSSPKEQEERIEQKLSLFLQEMKQENDSFITQVKQLNKKEVARTTEQSMKEIVRPHPVQEKLQVNHHDENKRTHSSISQESTQVNKDVRQSNESSFQSLLEKTLKSEETAFESSREAKILHLHSEGNTVEEIAKKLDIGKTEVELIVKIQQNQRK